jgi:hypothetical protein
VDAAYRIIEDRRPPVADRWNVVVDPEFAHRRRTFDVPVDGLIAFISAAFARGTRHVLLSDGKNYIRVSRADNPSS